MENSTYFVENLTLSNKTSFLFKPEIWIADFVICGMFAVVSLYLFVALLYSDICHLIAVIRQKNLLPTRHFVNGLIYCSMVALLSCSGFVSNILNIFRLLLDANGIYLSSSFLQDNAQRLCRLVSGNVVYASIMRDVSAVGLMWFYSKPIAKKVRCELKFDALSTVIINIVLFAVYLPRLFLVLVPIFKPIKYVYSKNTCKLKNHFELYASLIMSWSVLTFFIESAMLGFFAYCLRKIGQQLEEKMPYLRKKIKQAAIITSVTILSDVLSDLVLYLRFAENATIPTFPFVISQTIHMLIIVSCFDCWKRIVWPCSSRKAESNMEETQSATNLTQPMITNKKV